jgi:DNA-directed RNA polymerase subunit K/omega
MPPKPKSNPIIKEDEDEDQEVLNESEEYDDDSENDEDIQTDQDNDDNDDSDIDVKNDDSDESAEIEPVSREHEDSDDGEEVLRKFTEKMRNDTILQFHPESISHNYDEVKMLVKIRRNADGVIDDELHKTIPILTKYEKTRILGQRAKQLETGSQTFINPYPEGVVDSYLLSQMEFDRGLIPFIIRRPLPGGKSEYWCLNDLEKI